MLRLAICDDEALFLNSFQIEFGQISTVMDLEEYQLDVFQSGKDFAAVATRTEYDAAFLDIDMKDINGFDIAKSMQESYKETLIVFITNRNDLVFEALSFHPHGFIRKDHMKEDILNWMPYFIDERKTKRQFITFDMSGQKVRLKISDIYYIESDRNYLNVYTANDCYRLRDSLKSQENLLSKFGFVRVHSAFLVNIKYVFNITNNSVTLDDGQVIPVSRQRIKTVKEALHKEMMHGE